MSPTEELYAPLTIAYNHFNKHLFDNELPPVIFTLQRKKNVMGFFAAKRWGNTQGKMCSEISINPSYFASSRVVEIMQTMVHEMVHAWQYHFGNPSDGHYHNREWAQKMMDVGLMPSDTGEPGGAIVGRNMSDFIMKQGAFMNAMDELLTHAEFKLNWVDRLALPKLHEPVIVDGVKPSLDDNVVQFATSEEMSQAYIQNLSQHIDETLPPSINDNFSALPESFFIKEVAKRQTRSKHVCPGCDTKVYGKASLNIICGDCELPYVIDI
jgi:hypothetical protein